MSWGPNADMTLVNRTNVKNEAPEKSVTNDVTRTKGGGRGLWRGGGG